ncbi:MAG TPA: polyamine aminopropyltransferase [Micropepsaceae bacterium]|nr:polyamine aminopropyltransferase [Micropepsaceae bacterium]
MSDKPAETFTEKLHPGYSQVMHLKGSLIAEEKSQFQHIKFFDTERNGRVMVLDDIVQITTRDECAYSEMLTHVPMFEHGKVQSVLIVGGGDMAIAEEALKHKGVKEVVMAEIDGRVVDLSKEYFASLNARAVKDKRFKIEIVDAFDYLARPDSARRFDLIIADRPDPVGPAKVLFADTFYKRVLAALKPGGFAVFQNGVPFYQPEELTDTLKQMKKAFPKCGTYLSVVPTYIGGFMALTWVSKGGKLGDPKKAAAISRAFKASKIKTDYYTPAIHQAAFAIPAWIQRLIP